jgi:hypothetical protein
VLLATVRAEEARKMCRQNNDALFSGNVESSRLLRLAAQLIKLCLKILTLIVNVLTVVSLQQGQVLDNLSVSMSLKVIGSDLVGIVIQWQEVWKNDPDRSLEGDLLVCVDVILCDWSADGFRLLEVKVF